MKRVVLAGLAFVTCLTGAGIAAANELIVNRLDVSLSDAASASGALQPNLEMTNCGREARAVCTYDAAGQLAFVAIGDDVGGPLDTITMIAGRGMEQMYLLSGFATVIAAVEPDRDADDRGEIMTALVGGQVDGPTRTYETDRASYSLGLSSATGFTFTVELRN